MTPLAKIELAGEAKFLRALCYFYLTNLFGDVPLVLSDDFNQTVLLAKTPKAGIYQQMVTDLLDAESTLPADFSQSGGQPIRANKWAAAALLARVYLYLSNWTGADSAAGVVINSGQFSLVPLPLVPSDGFPSYPPSDSDVFQANNQEAILQLQSSAQMNPYTAGDGIFFNPYSPGAPPQIWLTPQLLNAFEPNDLRRLNWLDSSNVWFSPSAVYYPYKYKIYTGNAGGPILENCTLLRLAEQYLIRAEAEANLKQLGAAIADLNAIRARAGLDSLPASLGQDSVLAKVQQENRIEFFGELGHRWFDLKRWGLGISVLGIIPYKHMDSAQLLYPIPAIELQDDPNLTQNPGYLKN